MNSGTNKSRMRYVFQTSQFVLAVILIVFLLWKLDIGEVLKAFHTLSVGWLLLSWLCILSVFYCRALVLCWIAENKARLAPTRVFLLNILGSFFTNFLPSRAGGDLVKGVYLAEYFPSMSDAYAAMILQRLVGIVGAFAVIVIATLVLFPFKQALWVLVPAVVIVAGISVLAKFSELWETHRKSSWAMRMERFVITRLMLRLVDAMVIYRHEKRRFVAPFLFSMAITCQGILGAFLAGRAVGSSATFTQIFVASTAAQISAFIPLTPGGLGVGESSFVLACLSFGVPKEEAFATAVLVRLILVSISLLGGAFYLFNPIRRNEP
ncbi:MAG TPA: lysylphosphatidylglycerol synthase transmembrane domain-containing protein [bacterium]|nr:lysylphosphatidylglycerol synthase transmembrane domain-containing protein [bacterium]